MKGAAQRWIVASLTSLVVVGGSVAWGAEATEWGVPITDKDRVFRNYTRETATVEEDQFRLEVRGLVAEKDGNARLNAAGFLMDSSPEVNAGYLDLVGTYGFAKGMEAGFIITGIWQGTEQSDGSFDNVDGVGDFLMYGKFQREVLDDLLEGKLNAGAGMELTTPNGSESKGLGAGDVGVNPFISARWKRGAIAFGSHLGWNFYAGDTADVFNYSIYGIIRPSSVWAFRTEWSGRLFTQGGGRQWDAVFMPGIDFNLTEQITIRPTGLARGSTRSYDWGVGLGAAYAF
jgi:hypothetical protein